MDEQKGALKLKGTHGDFTFAETVDGFVWKKKRKAVSLDTIMTNPDLVKIKHHIQEFGRAGKGVKLIRTAFFEQLNWAKDRRLTSRMQTLLVKLVKSDTTNGRGDRLVQNGDFRLLNNFEMNGNAELQRSIAGKDSSTAYDRVSGNVTIDVPSFIPSQTLKHTANATHYRIICAAAEFDFENGEYILSETASHFDTIEAS